MGPQSFRRGSPNNRNPIKLLILPYLSGERVGIRTRDPLIKR